MVEFLNNLEYSWTAQLKDNNGNIHSIWWTAWPMCKKDGWEILSVSSDLPKCKISNANFIIK